jgi:hypothetical protein
MNSYQVIYRLMPTKKPKVTIYLTEAHKAELHRWAEEEKRSISNLVELLLEKILSDRTPPSPDNGEAPQTEPKQGQRQPSNRGKGKEG